MENNLDVESCRVANQVKNWANVLDFLGVEYHSPDSSGPFLIACPSCHSASSVVLTVKGQDYPRWHCRICLANRKRPNHNSFLCLFKLIFQEKNEELSEGKILGKVEAFILSAKTSSTFVGGGYVLDFGSYKNFKLREVPLNYLRYLSEPKHTGLKIDIKNDIRNFLGLPLLSNKPMKVIEF